LRLGVRRQRLVAGGCDGHDAPQLTLDGNRRPGGRAVPPVAPDEGRRTGGVPAVVVDPHRLARLEDQCAHVLPAEGDPSARGQQRYSGTGAAPRAEDGRQAVRVVPGHGRQVGAGQPPGFGGDRGEHLLRRRTPGDQHRDPAQRGLLLGVAAQFHARLGVGDRGAGQFSEAGQPDLGVRGQWFLAGGCDGHDAPQLSLHGDRHPDRHAEPQLTAELSGLAGGLEVVLDPHRAAGLEDQRGHVVSVKAHPGARTVQLRARAAPSAEDQHHAAWLIPGHRCQVSAQQAPGLCRDRGEYLLGQGPAGDHGRHPAQRGQLSGNPVIWPSLHRGSHPERQATSSPSAQGRERAPNSRLTKDDGTDRRRRGLSRRPRFDRCARRQMRSCSPAVLPSDKGHNGKGG